MELHLNADEHALLQELLLECQRRLLMEICKASHADYKALLRMKEDTLESLLAKLSTPMAA